MHNYECIIFDLYNTLIDDTGMEEREKYRIDSIYTILERSLFPVSFKNVSEKYGEMTMFTAEYNEEQKIAFSPFYQVNYLLNSLNVHDIVIFKKVYDVYTDAVLQISPKLLKNAQRALKLLKERDKKVGLISNTGKTPGVIIRMLLKELNVFEYFDDMVFSDEVGFMKPDPRIFNISIDRLNTNKRETIFIGDIKKCDYDGAINAGLNAHLFNRDEEDLLDVVIAYSGGID